MNRVKATLCAGIPPIVLDGNFWYLYHISSFSFSHFQGKSTRFQCENCNKNCKKINGKWRELTVSDRNEKPTKASASVGLNDFYDLGDF